MIDKKHRDLGMRGVGEKYWGLKVKYIMGRRILLKQTMGRREEGEGEGKISIEN